MLPKEEEVKKMSRTALQKAAVLFEKEFKIEINRGGKTEEIRDLLLGLLKNGNVKEVVDDLVEDVLEEEKLIEEELPESTPDPDLEEVEEEKETLELPEPIPEPIVPPAIRHAEPEPEPEPVNAIDIDKSAIQAEIVRRSPDPSGPSRVRTLKKILAEKGISMDDYNRA